MQPVSGTRRATRRRIKVTEAQTLLFLSGQVAREADGSVRHRGDFMGQAREAYRAVKALVEAGGGTLDEMWCGSTCI